MSAKENKMNYEFTRNKQIITQGNSKLSRSVKLDDSKNIDSMT